MKLLHNIALFSGIVCTSLLSMEYQEPSPKATEINGDNLEQAIKKGDKGEIKLLLMKGLSPHASGSYFKSHPMIVAAGLASLPLTGRGGEPCSLERLEAKEIIRLLMERTSAVPNIRKESEKFLSRLDELHKDIYTPVRVRERIAKGIKDLIDETLQEVLYADSEANRRDSDGRAPLHKAAQENNKEFVQDLINAGADVNIRDRDGNTPLHEAAYAGATEVIRSLVKAGAKLDAEDQNGDTPLHKAVFNKKSDTAQLLIELGAPIDNKNKAGKMPLEMAQEVQETKSVPAPASEKSEIKDEEDKECPICLEEFNKEIEEILTQCNHKFHKQCLAQIKECPMCRQEIKQQQNQLKQE